MNARNLPLIVGLVPIVAINICYWLAAQNGSVPSCVPYLEGCTSVSATGRHPPASFLFRATMLPIATLIIVYWRLCAAWLKALGVAGRVRSRSLYAVGGTAGLFLILYVTFLGSEGDFYNLMRRYGITVFFGFNYLAQLLLAERMLQAAASTAAPPALRRIGRVKLAICVVLMAIGLASIPVMNFVLEKDRIQNVMEWNFALLMFANFALTWFAWRATAFQVRPSVRSLSG
ncbi:MAG: hypothetical protein ACREVN_13125 [Gammaproteobacteria bacterium]